MAARVKVSVKTGCLATLGLMRGPASAPHADFGAEATGAAAGAREGKAAWKLVSTWVTGA